MTIEQLGAAQYHMQHIEIIKNIRNYAQWGQSMQVINMNMILPIYSKIQAIKNLYIKYLLFYNRKSFITGIGYELITLTPCI